MKAQHTDEEPIDFDQYDPDARREFLDPQHKITKFTPIGGNNMLRWFKILMMMDNFADDPPSHSAFSLIMQELCRHICSSRSSTTRTTSQRIAPAVAGRR